LKKPLPAKTAQRDYPFELELDQFLHDEPLDIDLPELDLSAVDLFLPDEDLVFRH
jgi:hypothetical protein